jgi:hypothetical protein
MNTVTIEPTPGETGTIVPLSVNELAALLECESVIRKEQAAFVRVGHALARIRDGRLYRMKYRTFEEYCEGEWDMSDRYGRALRTAADVVDVLEEKQFALLPATESQARPLSKLPREEWVPAWEEVLQTAPNGKPTANHVVQVVQRRMNRLAGVPSDTEVIKKSEVRSEEPEVTASEPSLAAITEETVLAVVRVPPMPIVAPARPENVIDVEILTTRENRIRAIAREAQLKMRELADAIGTGHVTASKVAGAIQDLDELQAHYSRREDWLGNRSKERSSKEWIS